MYNSQFELGPVALNVRNLELQSLFYQQVLGLQILSEHPNQIDLGVGQKSLVRLIQTEQVGDVSQSYGLYHLAIVLPSREDLGTIFRHFIDNKIPLQGASDHGYSEAIYLADTEGNGIEIYRDLPQDTWDVRPDDRIVGITEPMDAETIYALGKKADAAYQMPAGSRMGHVHLSVRESAASSRFYQEVLAVEDKFSVPSASWLASGDYHHHLAVNEWGGKNLKTRQEGMPGLAYYSVIYSQADTFKATLERASAAGLTVQKLDKAAAFVDVDGIKTQLLLSED
ncbi:TPA: VOC family protein [Streptococcus suis]|uniref:VOC family protein n=1 Tax=Streptococcus suis TaxID=1307 RepID=UPI000CF40381|nr:VOC family protein [Streptococcus suis]MCK4019821.1 VOC family protein [Streptococcus suis]HEL2376567.1 VOC family protein [Streptococcus suis]HEL2692550.1 VOC family protein [Streptococcus suis]HEM5200306.1 VOC family protein [Streptococcus suis]HEM6556260.1 VOC family protein [Streptococcus suis]